MKGQHTFAGLLLIGVICVWLVLMGVAIKASVLPNMRGGKVLVVFGLRATASEAFATIVKAGGNPVRQTWLKFVWVAQSPANGFVGRLKQYGAVAALDEFQFSPQLAGCFAFSTNANTFSSLKSKTQ